MKTTLTLRQFSNFLAAVWNEEAYKQWGDGSRSFWQGVAVQEFSRTFQDGWDYCESSLTFAPREGKHWWYKTTSGTIFVVTQGCWVGENNDLPEIQISVEIPAHRAAGTHANLLIAAIDGMDFYSWGSLFYAKENTPQHTEARRVGMVIASDPEEIAARKARKAQIALEVGTEDEGEDEDYEEYEED